MTELRSKLLPQITGVLNAFSAENESNTPDFILASFLLNCLQAFENATRERDHWHNTGVLKPALILAPSQKEMGCGFSPVVHPELGDVEVYTTGELIDRISIVNCKIYALEDVKRNPESGDIDVAFAARKIQALNDERSQLKNAITRRIDGAAARQDVKVKT